MQALRNLRREFCHWSVVRDRALAVAGAGVLRSPRLLGALLGTAITAGLSLPVEAAKPSGGADTRPPGSISNVQLLTAERGVALGFTATGDDGSSGQATGYETNVWMPVANSSSCGPIPASGWIQFTMPGQEPRPRPAGQGDAVDWMDLDAGTSYCAAIKVLDEVGNYSLNGPYLLSTAPESPSGWALTGIDAAALPGRGDTTTFSPLSYLLEEQDTGRKIVVRVDTSGFYLAGVAGNDLAQGSIGVQPATPEFLASATVESGGLLEGYSLPSDTLVGRTTGVAAIPLDPNGWRGIAIALRARDAAGVIRPLLLKFRYRESAGALTGEDTWAVEALPFDPQAEDGAVGSTTSRGWGVHMVYLGGQLTLTYQTSAGTTRALWVAEQAADGTWNESSVLTRQQANKRARMPNFNTGAVLDAASGNFPRLGIWLNQGFDGSGGMTNGLYLVRCGDPLDPYCIDPNTGSSSGWVWYDTGAPAESQSTSFRDLAALDPSGKLRVIDEVSVSNGPRRLETIAEDGFGEKFYGLSGAATSKRTRTRQTIYTAQYVGGVSGAVAQHSLAFSDCGYHLAFSVADPTGSTVGYGERAYKRGFLHVRGSGPAVEEPIQFSPSYRGNWQPNQNGFTEGLFVDHAIDGTRLARSTAPLCPWL